jgi:hypothetical protein
MSHYIQIQTMKKVLLIILIQKIKCSLLTIQLTQTFSIAPLIYLDRGGGGGRKKLTEIKIYEFNRVNISKYLHRKE